MSFPDINKQKLDGLARLQAVFRGYHSREVHIKRAKNADSLVCPFYSCTTVVVKAMIDIANIKKEDTVIDLGCGDGAILIEVARSVGCLCTGIDIDPILCKTSRRLSIDAGIDHLITIHEDDFTNADISTASVVCLFLVPSCLAALSGWLRAHGRPGARIVCYKFPLPDDEWRPIRTATTDDVINTKNKASTANVYLYVL